jgi:hypothetical protein
MEPAAIVAEIRVVRERIEQDARRIYDLAQTLHHKARRTAPTVATPAYLMYSNAWIRFAGMVSQGMRRTVTAEKVIVPAMEQEKNPPPPPPPLPEKKPKDLTFRSPLPFNDDLVELFGEELGNASQ